MVGGKPVPYPTHAFLLKTASSITLKSSPTVTSLLVFKPPVITKSLKSISKTKSDEPETVNEPVTTALPEKGNVFIRLRASDAEPDNAVTDELIVWSVVVNDALSAIDDPLILATIAFLDVDADELNADIGAVD